MNQLLKEIQRWLEVWPYLLPVIILLATPNGFRKSGILGWFIAGGFLLSFLSTFTWRYGALLPEQLRNNNILYNLNSILRTLICGYFIARLSFLASYRHLYWSGWLFTGFLLINFIFFDSVFLLSTRLHAAESIVLLTVCLTFFLHLVADDEVRLRQLAAPFIFCAGLAIFESVSFFVYLFFYPNLTTDYKLSKLVFNISRYSYAFFIIMTGISLIVQFRMEKSKKLHPHYDK